MGRDSFIGRLWGSVKDENICLHATRLERGCDEGGIAQPRWSRHEENGDQQFRGGLVRAMSETIRAGEVQGAGGGRRDEPLRARNGYAKRLGRFNSALFTTPCATPMTAIMAGFVLAQRWHSGLTPLLVVAAFAAVRPAVTSVWMERLSTATGVSLYCAAAYSLWPVAIGPDIQGVPRFLAGALLGFLSFSTWVSSLLLEGIAAWVSRGIAAVTLAAAVLILGGGIG